MPRPNSWGFVAFVACAVIAAITISQRDEDAPASSGSDLSAIAGAADDSPFKQEMVPVLTAHAVAFVSEPQGRSLAGSDATDPLPRAVSTSRKSAASMSVITFESNSIVTSEAAVAAVFVLARSPPLKGTALIQWESISGTADAAIDFSDASGTVEFADGQASRAIYVPLRNDLLKEENETFKVCLHSPQRARLGARSCVEATIRDND